MLIRSSIAATLSFAFCCISAFGAAESTPASTPPYSQIHAVFQQHCLSCHNAKDAEGELVMETYPQVMKGGENGPAVMPGKPDESRLILSLEHKKKPFMPPAKKKDTLNPEEIALLRSWVAGGAPGPKEGEIIAVAPVIPDIKPKGNARKPVQSIVYSAKGNLLAIARAGDVEVRSADGQTLLRTLTGHKGNVNALAFTPDATLLAAGAGEAGQSGEVRLWNVSDGTLVRTFTGHRDAVYCVAISPDGKLLVSGSYDQKITLWDLSTGQALRDLTGHNGAVFGVAFRPDGKVLASASADRTLKLWDVATGKRLDTRSEPTKELYTIAFSPDGGRVFAAGGDNRIRVWQVSREAIDGSNPILFAKFAHEGAILRLAFSADGKSIVTSADDATVKLSSADDLKSQVVFPKQPDWPTAVTFGADDKSVIIGRLDGSVAYYDAKTGKELPPPKPDLSRLEPIGIQRGKTSSIKAIGKNLGQLTGVKIIGAPADKLTAKLVRANADQSDDAGIELTAAADLPPGPYKIAVVSTAGMSQPLTVYVDTLPQATAQEPSDSTANAMAVSLPVSVWGGLKRADGATPSPSKSDHYAFDAKAGQTIVFDATVGQIGSKADLTLTLLDANGKILANSNGLDDDPEPLLAHTFERDGRYIVRVTDVPVGEAAPAKPKKAAKPKAAAKTKGATKAKSAAKPAAAKPIAEPVAKAPGEDPAYRLSIGSFAVVTGSYPLAISANGETRVELVGFNVPANAAVSVKAPATGEVDVPLDPDRYRSRRPLRVIVSPMNEVLESEPNDKPQLASKIAVPGAASGRIDKPLDADLFMFEAKKGQTYVVETLAARRGSPVDTRVEVLWPDGKPVERVQLRAVRDSYINFRAIDGNIVGARFEHYLEIELNQYMYMNGEVVRLFLAPRGPDADFGFYPAANGKRRAYFDTTPTSHALDEKTYIVEPHPPGEALTPNGLPVFTLNYANDDDADRQLGADSRLLFVAPRDGSYLVRVTDTRGFGGDRFVYRLVVRPANPSFEANVALNPATVVPGTGRTFDVKLDRIDGFDGPVRVDLTGAPAGWQLSTPVVIEPGHLDAKGTLYAPAGVKMPEHPVIIKATASATIDGKSLAKALADAAPVLLAEKSLPTIRLEPMPTDGITASTSAPGGAATCLTTAALSEITVYPGKLVPAMLRVERNGFKGEIKFDFDNLPQGVIVSDIGLNGVLINEDRSDRQVFLDCAPWVADTDRLFHVTDRDNSKATSPPVLLHVRRPVQQAQTP